GDDVVAGIDNVDPQGATRGNDVSLQGVGYTIAISTDARKLRPGEDADVAPLAKPGRGVPQGRRSIRRQTDDVAGDDIGVCAIASNIDALMGIPRDNVAFQGVSDAVAIGADDILLGAP